MYNCVRGIDFITLSTITYFHKTCILNMDNKMKSTKYHTARIVPASNPKIVERVIKSIPLTQLYMAAHFPGTLNEKWRG
jgi:hypothetical protein